MCSMCALDLSKIEVDHNNCYPSNLSFACKIANSNCRYSFAYSCREEFIGYAIRHLTRFIEISLSS